MCDFDFSEDGISIVCQAVQEYSAVLLDIRKSCFECQNVQNTAHRVQAGKLSNISICTRFDYSRRTNIILSIARGPRHVRMTSEWVVTISLIVSGYAMQIGEICKRTRYSLGRRDVRDCCEDALSVDILNLLASHLAYLALFDHSLQHKNA